MKVFLYSSLLGVLLSMTSCSKKIAPITMPAEKTYTISYLEDKIAGTRLSPKSPYEWSFFADKRISLRFDINTCNGKYELGPNNSLDFSAPMACTKACCDEALATKILDVLHTQKLTGRQDGTLYYFENERYQFLLNYKSDILPEKEKPVTK